MYVWRKTLTSLKSLEQLFNKETTICWPPLLLLINTSLKRLRYSLPWYDSLRHVQRIPLIVSRQWNTVLCLHWGANVTCRSGRDHLLPWRFLIQPAKLKEMILIVSKSQNWRSTSIMHSNFLRGKKKKDFTSVHFQCTLTHICPPVVVIIIICCHDVFASPLRWVNKHPIHLPLRPHQPKRLTTSAQGRGQVHFDFDTVSSIDAHEEFGITKTTQVILKPFNCKGNKNTRCYCWQWINRIPL